MSRVKPAVYDPCHQLQLPLQNLSNLSEMNVACVGSQCKRVKHKADRHVVNVRLQASSFNL